MYIIHVLRDVLQNILRNNHPSYYSVVVKLPIIPSWNYWQYIMIKFQFYYIIKCRRFCKFTSAIPPSISRYSIFILG